MKQIQKELKSVMMMACELSAKVSEIAEICKRGDTDFSIDMKTHYENSRHDIHLKIFVDEKWYELMITRDMVGIDFISKREHEKAWFKEGFEVIIEEIDNLIEELMFEEVMA